MNKILGILHKKVKKIFQEFYNGVILKILKNANCTVKCLQIDVAINAIGEIKKKKMNVLITFFKKIGKKLI